MYPDYVLCTTNYLTLFKSDTKRRKIKNVTVVMNWCPKYFDTYGRLHEDNTAQIIAILGNPNKCKIQNDRLSEMESEGSGDDPGLLVRLARRMEDESKESGTTAKAVRVWGHLTL